MTALAALLSGEIPEVFAALPPSDDRVEKMVREALTDAAPEEGRPIPAPVEALFRERGLYGVGISGDFAAPPVATRFLAALAERNPSAAFAVLSHTASLAALAAGGRDVKGPARGEPFLAYAVTEPETGTDAASMKTRITEEGGRLRIKGAKSLVSNAAVAGGFLVWGREGNGSDGETRLSCVYLEREDLNVEKVEPLSAFRDLPLGTLEIDCEVPLDRRVGGAGEGMRISEALLSHAHLGTLAICRGLAARAKAALSERLAGRTSFGCALSSHTPVAEPLATLAAFEASVEALLRILAHAGDEPALRAIAKAEATDRLAAALDAALAVAGGEALATAHPILAAYHDAAALRQAFGGNGALRLYAVYRALPERLVRRIAAAVRGFFRRPKFPLRHPGLGSVREVVEEGTAILAARGRAVREYYGSDLARASLEVDRLGKIAGEIVLLAALGLAADERMSAGDGDDPRVAAAVGASRAAWTRILRHSRDLYDFDDASVLEVARSCLRSHRPP